jgi:uncharacterized membrane protein YbhN (UPF0104 family)
VFPGGGAAASAIDYRFLKTRGFDSLGIAQTSAVVAALTYGALGLIFSGSLLYLIFDRELNPPETAAAILLLAAPILIAASGYLASRKPCAVEHTLKRLLRLLQNPNPRTTRTVNALRRESRTLRNQVLNHPGEAAKLGALSLGYWTFDALCLILMFAALFYPTLRNRTVTKT